VTVYVYSRQGCHLCECLIEELVPLIRDRAPLSVRDVDADPGWRERFGDRVPVVEVDGHVVCEYRLDRDSLETALARDG
jgi:hypothetical protein